MLTSFPGTAEKRDLRTATLCREIARREEVTDPHVAALVDASIRVTLGDPNVADECRSGSLSGRLTSAALGLNGHLTRAEAEFALQTSWHSCPRKIFTPVVSGGSVCGLGVVGRYLEIRTTLARGPQSTAGPVLYDLTLSGCDSTPPTISGMPKAGCTITSPNHKMVQVASITAADAESGLASLKIKVTSTEPENGLGDGDQAPDTLVKGDKVFVRAERSGLGQRPGLYNYVNSAGQSWQ